MNFSCNSFNGYFDYIGFVISFPDFFKSCLFAAGAIFFENKLKCVAAVIGHSFCRAKGYSTAKTSGAFFGVNLTAFNCGKAHLVSKF